MTPEDELRARVTELEAELGEALAAGAATEERLAQSEAALLAAQATLAVVAEPAFAAVLEEARNPVAARLRRRLSGAQARNEVLRAELAALRGSRTFRWTAPLRSVAGAVRRGLSRGRRA